MIKEASDHEGFDQHHSSYVGTNGESCIFHCNSKTDTTRSLEYISQILSSSHGIHDCQLDCTQLIHNCVQKAVQESRMLDTYSVMLDDASIGVYIRIVKKQKDI